MYRIWRQKAFIFVFCQPAATCMPIYSRQYEDWKDFFTKRLLDTGEFLLLTTTSKGNTEIETYSAIKGNPDTTIAVGYFSPMTIIYVHILNPATPGKNRQQELEHLYTYEFDPEKQYGPPGLDFNEINVKGINNYLEQGFNGEETVYYRNGKLVASRLTTSYYPDSPKTTTSYWFTTEPLINRLFKKLSGTGDRYDEVKNIDLSSVFKGLRSGLE